MTQAATLEQNLKVVVTLAEVTDVACTCCNPDPRCLCLSESCLPAEFEEALPTDSDLYFHCPILVALLTAVGYTYYLLSHAA